MARRRHNKQGTPKLLVFLVLLVALAVLLSCFAERYWFFELFSNFVWQYTLVFAAFTLMFLLFRLKWWALFTFVICASQAYQLAPLVDLNKLADEEGVKYENVRVLQYNVHRNNKNVDEVTRWVISSSEDIDIVVLLEVNERWEEALRRIKWAYPYHIVKDMRGGREMVVFSRLYIDELEVKYLGEEEAPAIVLRGETTGYEIPFVLYGIHPPPPVLPSYSKSRNDVLMATAESIAGEITPYKMLVADFNATRFSPTFKKVIEKSGLSDSNEELRNGIFNNTWPNFAGKFFGIPLDNILISDNIRAVGKKIGPAMGSDHLPVITTLKFKVPEKKEEVESDVSELAY